MQDLTNIFDFNLNEDPVILLIDKGHDYFKLNKKKDFSGVYACRCLVNRKIYIGSSVSLRIRVRTHIRELKKNIHANPVLQSSVNKYGIDNHQWFLIEAVDNSRSCKLTEQTYFDFYKPFVPEHFNINRDAFSAGILSKGERRLRAISRRKTEDSIVLISPEGESLEFNCSVAGFCEEIEKRGYKISFAGISRLLNGKVSYYKSWSLPGAEPKKYRVEHIATGEIFDFSQITSFVREKKISSVSAFSNMLFGKSPSSNGYKLPYTKILKLETKFLRNPNGKIISFINFEDFAEENKMKVKSLRALIHGNLPVYKGFSLPSDTKQKKWTFIDPNGEEWTTSSIKKFAEERGLNPLALNDAKKRGYSHKGWKYKKE